MLEMSNIMIIWERLQSDQKQQLSEIKSMFHSLMMMLLIYCQTNNYFKNIIVLLLSAIELNII